MPKFKHISNAALQALANIAAQQKDKQKFYAILKDVYSVKK